MARTKTNGKAWKPIDKHVPRETTITLKTVKGIICKGYVPKKAKMIKPWRSFGERIPAKRTDYTTGAHIQGDVRAVAWR